MPGGTRSTVACWRRKSIACSNGCSVGTKWSSDFLPDDEALHDHGGLFDDRDHEGVAFLVRHGGGLVVGGSTMHRLARLLLLTLAPLLVLAACQREGPAERTGRNIDRGVDRDPRPSGSPRRRAGTRGVPATSSPGGEVGQHRPEVFQPGQCPRGQRLGHGVGLGGDSA